MIIHLEPVDDVQLVSPPVEEHAMRRVTRQVAFDGEWDAVRAAKVAALFDGMAAEWTASHNVDGRYAPLDDALARGDVSGSRVVELGSGTGLGTRILAKHYRFVATLDLSAGMLANADVSLGAPVQADSAALPVATSSVDVVVLVNMLLFPSEVDRVLAHGGQIVWINTVGEATPIHLSAEEVLRALPGQWSAIASRSGMGTWVVATRA